MQPDKRDIMLYNTKEVAEILGRREETVRAYIRDYKIPCIKRKSGYKGCYKYYITRRDLEKFIFTVYNDGGNGGKPGRRKREEEPGDIPSSANET